MRKIKVKSKKRKRKIFVSFLLAWFLRFEKVKAVPPIIGVDGFTPICVCRMRRTYSYSREASSLTMNVYQNRPNQNFGKQNETMPDLTKLAKNDRYVKECNAILQDSQIIMKFKHSKDFAVKGDACRKNFELFKDHITQHMNSPLTKVKEGTYRKTIDVRIYYNEFTNRTVIISKDNNTFISAWKLSEKQLKNLQNRGSL